MSRITYSLGLLLACCALVLSIPPPEAVPAGAGLPLSMAQVNPFLSKFKPAAAAPAVPVAAADPPTAAAAAATTAAATTTLPPAVNNLIAKYKAAAAAFYPTMPVV